VEDFYTKWNRRQVAARLHVVGLSDSQIIVLLEMLTYWMQRKGSEIYPSRDTLADATGQTERNVTRAFKAFEKAGLLVATGGGTGRDPIHWVVTEKLCKIMGFAYV
jgi:hypothetical protein